jgi:sodium/proline symporter
MVTGFAVTLIWKLTGLSDAVVYELVPAFVLAGLAAICTSLLDRRLSSSGRAPRRVAG